MKLRTWKYADILRIAELEKECFPDEPWSFQMLVSSFESDTFHGVLAEDGGEIIGYGGITVSCDTADIANVAVTEAFRHSGVGSSILSELLSVAKSQGAQKVFLEVRVSNATAMSLYLKNGFKGVHARTRYYSNGEDCIVMAKEL
ncbi:MAG: ribosomal protein S18-alanine N-acetyltransferase [Clostridiales bacterium]|nr:ribosomal protein S18-alanine N-acetyltransferase [Clostridiales bacterium]